MQNSTLAWSLIYTEAHHERKVAARLALKGIEAFVPVFRLQRRWKNRTTNTVMVPIFPRYVFVKSDASNRARVLADPGVLCFVDAAEQVEIFPERLLDVLRNGLCLDRIEPHPYLPSGPNATVARGPLMGLRGIRVKEGQQERLILSFELLKQSIAISVEPGELDEHERQDTGV